VVKTLVLYDGVCALCNGLTSFLLRRDRNDHFRFASLQSGYAKALLKGFGKSTDGLDTVYVVVDFESPSARVLSKGQAILAIGQSLGGLWRMSGLLRVIPPVVLDWVYSAVARRRYRLFGKFETCQRPLPQHRMKFVDEQADA
jgi:predicted DCC family thiol-disulfide oxidoreductase YuxK